MIGRASAGLTDFSRMRTAKSPSSLRSWYGRKSSLIDSVRPPFWRLSGTSRCGSVPETARASAAMTSWKYDPKLRDSASDRRGPTYQAKR